MPTGSPVDMRTHGPALGAAGLVLALLLTADAVILGLHLVNAAIPAIAPGLLRFQPGWINAELLQYVQSRIPLAPNPMLHIEVDRGYPEAFQYLKYTWIVALLVLLAARQRRMHYLAWAIVFAYLLLDDSLGLHERGGGLLAAWLDIPPAFGLPGEDYGQLITTGLVALALSVPLAIAWLRGSDRFRAFSRDLGMLLLLLVVFGVGFDTLHALGARSSPAVDFVLCLVEDGGELIVASLIVAAVSLDVAVGRRARLRVVDAARLLRGRRTGLAQRASTSG